MKFFFQCLVCNKITKCVSIGTDILHCQYRLSADSLETMVTCGKVKIKI